jgi:hypothetical protein
MMHRILELQREAAGLDWRALARAGAWVGVPLLALLVAGIVALTRASKSPGELTSRSERLSARGIHRVELAVRARRAATLRFAGEARAVTAGPESRHSFEVPEARLKVGDNRLEAELVDREGRNTKHAVVLEVPYALRADFGQVQKGNLVLRVATAEDASLKIDGEPQTARSPGQFEVTRPIARIVGKPLEKLEGMTHPLTVRVAVTRKGRSLEETRQLVVPLPVVPLLVATPLPGAEIDTAKLVVAGKTQKGAQVTIYSSPARVDAEGRFRELVSISPGDNGLRVVARAPGLAPNVIVIPVRRRLTPRLAAADWAKKVDASLTYSVLQKNPLRHKGARVHLKGRITAIQERGGVNTVDVNTCRWGRACAVRVTFQGETDLVNRDWAEIYGEIAGEHQSTTPSGARIAVPAVTARWLFKYTPPAEPR